MFGMERQSLILEALEREGKVEVSVLATRFSTSQETIRRDLKEMASNGLLERKHGGAVIVAGHREGYELPLMARGVHRYDEKQRICKATAKLLEDGDTIFLDNSSTAMNLLTYVPKTIKITVLTNSIQVILEAGKLDNDNIMVLSVGGIFNAKNYSIVGMLSKSFAQNFFPDKAIMSCKGIDEKSGMTDGGIHEVELKREIINRSKELFLLADHSKFGLVGAVYLGSLNEVDCIVTDSKTDKQRLKVFEQFQAKVILAE